MKKDKIDRLSEKFDKPIVQYVKSRKRRVGVLFAGVVKDDPNRVAVGFSLCCPKDQFDKATRPCGCRIKKDGMGVRMAQSNSLRWINNSFVFTSPKSDAPPFEAFVKVPMSFLQTKKTSEKPIFVQFVERLKRYYKDKTLPAWIAQDWEKMLAECDGNTLVGTQDAPDTER